MAQLAYGFDNIHHFQGLVNEKSTEYYFVIFMSKIFCSFSSINKPLERAEGEAAPMILISAYPNQFPMITIII